MNSKYTYSEFEKIYENILFKYFKITKNRSNNEELIEIDYLYPVIQDIFEEVYSFIILRKDFNNIFNGSISEGGSRGTFFEKLVIHNFNPGEHNGNSVNFFDKFLVKKSYSVPKYIPKDNEKKILEGNNKIKVENVPFLLKQSNFGGKDLDVVMVEYFGISANLFCFQITGHKKKNDLMNYQELQNNINTMLIYLKNFFDFKIASKYFCYIFDYSRIYEKKVKNMCYTLNNQNIKYIFYDINTSSFYDINNNKIRNIEKEMNVFKTFSEDRIQVGNYKLKETVFI